MAAVSNPAKVVTFHEPESHTAQYLLICPTTSHCAVIDSVLEFSLATSATATTALTPIVEYIQTHGLTCDYVLDTHAHADHVSGARTIQARVGGKLGIGRGITTVQALFKRVFGLDDLVPDGRDFDVLFDDGATFKIGALDVRVINTPGHTPACVSYVVGDGDCVFVGDTIFMPDMGTARCDFPGGSVSTLWASIQRLFTLPDATRVFCCHDYAPGDRKEYRFETTIAEQKAANKHVHVGVAEAEFIKWRTERDATLSLPNLFIPSLQINIRAGALPAAERNGVSYLKWPVDLFARLNDFAALRGKTDLLPLGCAVYRDKPSEETIRAVLAQGGFASVLSLRGAAEPGVVANERELCTEAGVVFANTEYPVPPAAMPPAVFDTLLAELAALPRPVFVHCATGARAATLVTTAAAIEAGTSADDLRQALSRQLVTRQSLIDDALAALARR